MLHCCVCMWPLLVAGNTVVWELIWLLCVEPLIVESGQPPYNGQTVHRLPPYISTSEGGTTSEQWTNTCPQRVHYSEVPFTICCMVDM